MEQKFRKFVPFVKVDSVNHTVYGLVTAETPDKDDEVCDYEKSKPYYKALRDEMEKASGGKNLFPLREMHQLSAVGKAIQIDFNDSDKAILMGFKVVDKAAWEKVEELVYTGFSQGGRKVGEQVPDPVFKGCMRYVADPSEVSLVDNPCHPDAHFTYVKADGSEELRKFARVDWAGPASRVATLEREVTLLKAQQEQLMKGGNRPGDGSQPYGDVDYADPGYQSDKKKRYPLDNEEHIRAAWNYIAKPKNARKYTPGQLKHIRSKIVAAWKKKIDPKGPPSAEKIAAIREIARKTVLRFINERSNVCKAIESLPGEMNRLAKGMYQVSSLAGAVETLAMLYFQNVSEQEWEGDDDSKVPALLAENVSDVIETLLECVNEESQELLTRIEAGRTAAA